MNCTNSIILFRGVIFVEIPIGKQFIVVRTNSSRGVESNFKKRKKRANVYRFFGIVEDKDDVRTTQVDCRLCDTILRYNQNTNNLIDQLFTEEAPGGVEAS